jgi:hypothetical protein
MKPTPLTGIVVDLFVRGLGISAGIAALITSLAALL